MLGGDENGRSVEQCHSGRLLQFGLCLAPHIWIFGQWETSSFVHSGVWTSPAPKQVVFTVSWWNEQATRYPNPQRCMFLLSKVTAQQQSCDGNCKMYRRLQIFSLRPWNLSFYSSLKSSCWDCPVHVANEGKQRYVSPCDGKHSVHVLATDFMAPSNKDSIDFQEV